MILHYLTLLMIKTTTNNNNINNSNNNIITNGGTYAVRPHYLCKALIKKSNRYNKNIIMMINKK